MSTNEQKYLVLRGKNKDIYFMQKRLSKVQAAVYGKEFIKKSLETKDLNDAIRKRDEILKKLDLIRLNEEKNSLNESNIISIKDQNTSPENYMSTNQEKELSFDKKSSNNVPISSDHNNFLDKDENQEKNSSNESNIISINDQSTPTENYMSTNKEKELSFDKNFSNNVPIESNHNNFIDKDEDQKKYSIFSLKLPKIPEKEDLIVKIDKIIPIAIVLITLFIALIA